MNGSVQPPNVKLHLFLRSAFQSSLFYYRIQSSSLIHTYYHFDEQWNKFHATLYPMMGKNDQHKSALPLHIGNGRYADTLYHQPCLCAACLRLYITVMCVIRPLWHHLTCSSVFRYSILLSYIAYIVEASK